MTIMGMPAASVLVVLIFSIRLSYLAYAREARRRYLRKAWTPANEALFRLHVIIAHDRQAAPTYRWNRIKRWIGQRPHLRWERRQ